MREIWISDSSLVPSCREIKLGLLSVPLCTVEEKLCGIAAELFLWWAFVLRMNNEMYIREITRKIVHFNE